MLEALEAEGVARPDSILLRDYSDINVAAGGRLIAEKGLGDIARFEKGDAFDAASLAAIEPKPTLGLVSGLYELFPDNDLVKRSLGGLAAAIPAGGYLIYTGQPWHPQLEFIARALTSHRQGQAWVMRRRTRRRWTSWSRTPASRSSSSASTNGASSPSRSPPEGNSVTVAAPAAPGERPARRPWRRALLWLASLGALFYTSYRSPITSPTSVPTCPRSCSAGKRACPFLPWTIIPYWSINLFYAGSLFVCTTKAEVDTLGRRLLTAQLIAVTCFILLPLRFSFAKPDIGGGLPGFLFGALMSFDKPYNQAPSLHIALLVILWAHYARHMPSLGALALASLVRADRRLRADHLPAPFLRYSDRRAARPVLPLALAGCA